MIVSFEKNGTLKKEEKNPMEIVQIICEKCEKIEGLSEVQANERSTVTIKVPECSHCAYIRGEKEGYEIGWKAGAKWRGRVQ